MAYEGEENISVIIDDDISDSASENTGGKEYSPNDLWGNIKLFYEQEISE